MVDDDIITTERGIAVRGGIGPIEKIAVAEAKIDSQPASSRGGEFVECLIRQQDVATVIDGRAVLQALIPTRYRSRSAWERKTADREAREREHERPASSPPAPHDQPVARNGFWHSL